MDESTEKKKTNKHIERVTIGDAFKDKLTRLKDQATEALRGISSITRSDIVNLLIDEHPDELSLAQIDKLKATHVDQVKYAFWIAQRLKAAHQSGEQMTIHELLAQEPFAQAQKTKGNKRGPRKKTPSSSDTENLVTPNSNVEDPRD